MTRHLTDQVDAVARQLGTLRAELRGKPRPELPVTSATARANAVPRARADGTIDPAWLPPQVATSGTAFPASPTGGQRFFRTDRLLEYVWDGVRWLSTQEKDYAFAFPRVLQGSVDGTTSGQTVSGITGQAPIDQRYRTRWHYIMVRSFVATTNDASNYWRIQVIKVGTNPAATVYETTSIQDQNGNAVGANVSVVRTPAIAAESVAGDHLVYVQCTKVGAPGSLASVVDVKGRLIG
jgi:hypothetical protein